MVLNLRQFAFTCVFLTFAVFDVIQGTNENGNAIRIVEYEADGGQISGSYVFKDLESQNENLRFKLIPSGLKYSNPAFLDACRKNLTSSPSACDACLVIKTATSKGILTEDIAALAPVVVFSIPRNESHLNFTSVFHSSVWAFLLLAIIVCCGFLSAFEFFHPFGFGLKKLWTFDDEKKLKPTDVVVLLIGCLFLQSTSKRPASVAGNILALTWSAFCLCVVCLFIAGTVVSVFLPSPTSGHYLQDLPRELEEYSVVCPANDRFCDLVRHLRCANVQSDRCGLMRRIKQVTGSESQLARKLTWSEIAYVTDSFAASQILRRYPELSAVTLGPPVSSLAFEVANSALQQQLNRNILSMRERANISGGNSVSAPTGEEVPAIFAGLAKKLPIRLAPASSVFVLLAVGLMLSVVTLGSEFLLRTFVTKDYRKLSCTNDPPTPTNETRI